MRGEELAHLGTSYAETSLGVVARVHADSQTDVAAPVAQLLGRDPETQSERGGPIPTR
jgi:hypothetical protein